MTVNQPGASRAHVSIVKDAGPVRRIRTDIEAIEVARRLADRLRDGTTERDRQRRPPYAEVEELSASGLFAITVPKEYGGAGVSTATLVEVTAILSQADAAIGQILQNHFYMVEAIRIDGIEDQKRRLFSRILEGARVGTAYSGTRTVRDFQTRLTAEGSSYHLNGRKFHSTGIPLAHIIAAVANDDDGKVVIAFIEREAPGIIIVDDCSGADQRTIGNGTTTFENVAVTAEQIVPHFRAFERPTPREPFAQIVHAAVDLGIARAAIADSFVAVQSHTRASIDGGQQGDDGLSSMAAVGELIVKLFSVEEFLQRAGRFVDAAALVPTERSVAQASVAVDKAKTATAEIALEAAKRLSELARTSATPAEHGLDRHWRNVRAHTLHDAIPWKYHAVAKHWLDDAEAI